MGAPQSRLFEFATGLKERAWDVSIVTAMPNYPTGSIFREYRGRFSSEDKLDDIPVYRYWLYASNSPNAIPRVLSMLSFSLTSLLSVFQLVPLKPDIVFVESPPLTLGFTAYLLSRFTGSSLIVNISDIWPLSAYHLGAISKGFLYRRIEQLERFLYRNADLSTGQSEEIVRHLEESGAKKTFLFRNGVDVNRFRLSEDKNSSDGLRLVYAGLLGVAQGVFSICRTIDFKELGVEFHIYGDGYERKKIDEFLAENPDRGIYLHNPVGRNNIPGILASHDGTIIPLITNIYGAVPSKIYEAMASGLPILFSGDGEGASIVMKHNVGLVSPPGDMDALKKNIIEFIRQPEKRDEFSRNCVEAAKKVFDRRLIIDRFDNVLRELVGGRKRSEVGRAVKVREVGTHHDVR
jgi:glycosyltransferase involved in cell wall biosynthesis